MLQRLYSTAAAAAAVPRHTLKKLGSRKTYLVDSYTHLLRNNAVVLALHNSTLLKREDVQLRRDIHKAGGSLTVVRGNLFGVALRGLGHPDPASAEAARQFGRQRHAFAGMLQGPSAVVSVPELDPSAVNKIVNVLDKSGNRLVLLGGLVDAARASAQVLSRPDVDAVRQLPTLPQLQAQLAGVLTVLGGAGLVQTLESSSNVLYLTLKQHSESETEESQETPGN